MSWRPTASLELLRRRAAALARLRAFFAARNVLEVHTPAMVNAAVSDVHIRPFAVDAAGQPRRFLHTSPEYAMKRLLAAGSGDIYQVCSVFREGERGRLHNPEFTLLEWYRLSFSLDELMAETCAVVQLLLEAAQQAASPARAIEHLSYREAFLRELQIDPLAPDTSALRAQVQAIAIEMGLTAEVSRDSTTDELLDLLMGARVGPRLGWDRLTCLHRYPASQAALAQLDPQDPRVALRFELYADGLELANGFVELADAAEQRRRFTADLAQRGAREALDERLLAALEAGLPPCAGVAVGLERVLMVASGAEEIDAVLAFPVERA